MNKKIKKVIAIALTISAFSTIIPATTNLMTTKVYAATSDTQLKSIYLSDGTIDFSSSTYSYTVNVKKSVDEIRITAKPKNTDSTVEIDGTTVDEEDKYRETVSLDKGKNTIKIEVTDDDDDKTRTYTLKVYRGTSSSDDDYNNDDDYLDNIKVDGTSIDLSNSKTSYDVSVKEAIDQVKIKAMPEDEDYIVKINGSTVDEDDDYEKTMDLSKGKNTIQIKVKDDDYTKIYTLNITRGTIATTTPTTATTIKANQWVYVNGQMQYNDALGNPIKNAWFWDKNSGNYYYLDYNGYKVTGWKSDNSHWYLLDSTGAMETGWQYTNGAWYYFDVNGAMKTGWIKDLNGAWYYLNYNGTMRTGWLIDGGRYYHLNSNGSMDHNTTINGYKLGSDGAWTR